MMPLDVRDVLDVLSTICDEANLRVTVTESLKCGLIAGTCATVGGIFGGPVGVAIGGTLGSSLAAYQSHGKFKSVSQVLRELSPDQKQLLYKQSMEILAGLSIEDGLELAKIALGDPEVKQQLLGTIVEHVSGSLKLQIID